VPKLGRHRSSSYLQSTRYINLKFKSEKISIHITTSFNHVVIFNHLDSEREHTDGKHLRNNLIRHINHIGQAIHFTAAKNNQF
jgi:hypothetical protein